MLYREIIAVCSQIHTKHINTLCGQNVELLNVKQAVNIVTTGGTYSDHRGLKSSSLCLQVRYSRAITRVTNKHCCVALLLQDARRMVEVILSSSSRSET